MIRPGSHSTLCALFVMSFFTSCGQKQADKASASFPPTNELVDDVSQKIPKAPKIAHLALRYSLRSLDPVTSTSPYETEVQSQVYEGLYTYKYLKRPYELEPLLAKELPQVSEDGLTYTIDIREGVLFHDDQCFDGGKGRELVAKDFIYSIKRMADSKLSPTGWWAYADRIVGFDDFQRESQDDRTKPFQWDAAIIGLQAIGKYKLQIKLLRPYPQLTHVLAMSYSHVVPRECAEYYGKVFFEHPIGTGAFRFREWTRYREVILDKNPSYREVLYPNEASPEFAHLLSDGGKKVPFLDTLVYNIYVNDSPMWTDFLDEDLDLVQVPAQHHEEVFKEDFTLRNTFVAKGIHQYNAKLLDFIYRGFNMEDPIVGRGEKAKYLRQAISLAYDVVATNDAFYNGTSTLYDGPVPPGLNSYVSGVSSPYRGPNLDKAKALLVKAGYPGGKGLPQLVMETSSGGDIAAQGEMLTLAMKRIGVNVQVRTNSFAELSQKLKKGKAQIFGLAWAADYPDAENFLQLFYGPNSAPGSNNFNYKNPVYDALYDQARLVQPGPKRNSLYLQMRELLIEDAPTFGHMARTRSYLWHARLKNVLPDESFGGWAKYLNVYVPE